MQHMFGPLTATTTTATPTEDMGGRDTGVEDTSDNVSSTPLQKPIIQGCCPPALNKFQQRKTKGKAKARALTGAELVKGNSHTKKRCRRGVVSHQGTQEAIFVIPSTAPM